MKAVLSNLKNGDRFWSVRDLKRYTFVSFYYDDMFYHCNAWHDSHYDYDEFGCTLKIKVEEQKEPLCIKLRESSSHTYEPKTRRESLKFMAKTFSDTFLGYMDDGEDTLARNGVFGKHAIIWHDGTGIRMRFFMEFDDAYDLYKELEGSGMHPRRFDNAL